MGTLVGAVKKAWEELDKPDEFVKGEEFEHYVASVLFPDEQYQRVKKAPGFMDNIDGFYESSKEPDFAFRARKSGKEFYVEAKYRSSLYNGALDWSKPYQLKRYHLFDKTTPVFVAIGLGNRASEPAYVFLIPVRLIQYRGLFPSFLQKYEIPAGRPVMETDLLKLMSL